MTKANYQPLALHWAPIAPLAPQHINLFLKLAGGIALVATTATIGKVAEVALTAIAPAMLNGLFPGAGAAASTLAAMAIPAMAKIGEVASEKIIPAAGNAMVKTFEAVRHTMTIRPSVSAFRPA